MNVNDSPERIGWFYKIRIADQLELASLMSRATDEAFVETGIRAAATLAP